MGDIDDVNHRFDEPSDKFDNENTTRGTELMRALAHPLRMKILAFIDRQKDGVTPVKNIYKKLDIEQSITSQHLRILKETGTVQANKEGKFVYYRLNYLVIKAANDAVSNFLGKAKGE